MLCNLLRLHYCNILTPLAAAHGVAPCETQRWFGWGSKTFSNRTPRLADLKRCVAYSKRTQLHSTDPGFDMEKMQALCQIQGVFQQITEMDIATAQVFNLDDKFGWTLWTWEEFVTNVRSQVSPEERKEKKTKQKHEE